jgi:type IV pilus assembly protein PilE
MKKDARGLTLIELMVVIAIIAILATIAVVSWGRFVQRAARSEAMSALEDIAVKQEQSRLAQPRYASFVELASIFPSVANLNTNPGRKYEFEILCGNPARFTAIAAPRAGTSQAEDECGTFAIDQDGPAYAVDDDCDGAGAVDTYDGTPVADAACWKR